MTTRPRLAASVPFWGLITASVASAAAGAVLLIDKLGIMTATLTDGTATGIEVYVGQSVAGLGAVLVGAGVLGILLALTVATAASLRSPAAPVVVEPLDTAHADLEDDEAADHGYQRGLGYTAAVDVVEQEPLAEAR